MVITFRTPVLRPGRWRPGRRRRSRLAVLMLVGAVLLVSSVPVAGGVPSPAPGEPTTMAWSGRVSYVPEDPNAAPLDGKEPCPPSPGTVAECQETTITVPAGAGALYVKVSWTRPDYRLHVYAIAPDPAGTQYGLDYSKRRAALDKRTGNSTTLPFSEVSIPDPVPGAWVIRVRAAWGLDVDYTAEATVTSEPLIAWPREDPLQLARWATQEVDVNVVIAGFTLTSDQIAEVRSHLPDEYRLPVFHQGSPDEQCHADKNWGRCRYPGASEPGGAIPYFEPVRLTYRYHFLQADESFTRAAFAEMARLTRRDQSYRQRTVSAQEAYLAGYNATRGVFRGSAAQVLRPSKVDLIDAWGFEDWLFEHRFSDVCGCFRDLETGAVHGGGFIAPDPAARYDPYYDSGDVSRMPQGRNQGATIFFFDTFSPSYAPEYFRPGTYHNFSTEDHYVDPDTGAWAGIDYGRVWGGRYRFAFIDLGAAPNYQESPGSQNGSGGGSADLPDGDPPIWEYRNNSAFAGKFESRGIARNVATLLFSRMTAGFLYRPVPHDVYQLASTTISDYYSRPPFGTWATDLTRVYREDLAARWLSAAVPHATFYGAKGIPGFVPYRYPGCSDVHAGSKDSDDGAVMAPDPTCVGKVADPLQRIIELAKAQGIGAGGSVAQAVAPSVVRRFWEEHRDTFAPVADGVFTLVVINAVFEQAYAWFRPVIFGGIAVPTPTEEAWGIFQSVNDLTRPSSAIDCARSQPHAPGCDPVPSLPTPYATPGLTYTVEHEASHAIGLPHPHHFIGVERGPDGEWNVYYAGLAWMPDSTHSPTTYFAAIYPYGIWDQDNLMRGHAGEYLQQAQDAIADAYFMAGRRGIADIGQAPDVLARQALMTDYLEKGKAAFAAGDYLHAEYAFRNAYLAASGVTGPEVPPRRLRPGERVLFEVGVQDGPTRAGSLHRC